MPKKILLTSPTFPPDNSGLGNAVFQLAKTLVDEGWLVVVATGGSERSQIKDKHCGALIERFNISGASSIAQPMVGNIQSYVNYLKENAFDVILMNAWQTWSTDLVFSCGQSIASKKFLYSHRISTNSIVGKMSFHSLLRYLAWRPYWWSLPRKMSQLDGIFFLSGEGCDSRFDDLNLANKLKLKKVIIPNAISPEVYARIHDSKKDSSKREGILSVGAYEWQKGHEFVLNAYSQSFLKNKVHLNFYGQKFTPYTSFLNEHSLKLGIQSEYVHFHAGLNQDELFDRYLQSYLFLYGSHTECQPLVILDSMAAATPFVSKSSGSIPSMGGGISVSSEYEAAKAIECLYVNRGEWARLSKFGRDEAINKHSPDRVRELLISALDA